MRVWQPWWSWEGCDEEYAVSRQILKIFSIQYTDLYKIYTLYYTNMRCKKCVYQLRLQPTLLLVKIWKCSTWHNGLKTLQVPRPIQNYNKWIYCKWRADSWMMLDLQPPIPRSLWRSFTSAVLGWQHVALRIAAAQLAQQHPTLELLLGSG